MNLDREALKQACFDTARAVLWARRPVAVTDIEELSTRFFNDALLYEDFLAGQNRDPNLITSAVVYICNRHAIPPLADDRRWFGDILQVLIELCCPNQGGQSTEEPFFSELEAGIAEARADYEA